jgi:hypothetical protein
MAVRISCSAEPGETGRPARITHLCLWVKRLVLPSAGRVLLTFVALVLCPLRGTVQRLLPLARRRESLSICRASTQTARRDLCVSGYGGQADALIETMSSGPGCNAPTNVWACPGLQQLLTADRQTDRPFSGRRLVDTLHRDSPWCASTGEMRRIPIPLRSCGALIWQYAVRSGQGLCRRAGYEAYRWLPSSVHFRFAREMPRFRRREASRALLKHWPQASLETGEPAVNVPYQMTCSSVRAVRHNPGAYTFACVLTVRPFPRDGVSACVVRLVALASILATSVRAGRAG